MKENYKKFWYPHFFLSPEALCTKGIGHIDSGTRQGDSGGALNVEENGRLPYHISSTIQTCL